MRKFHFRPYREPILGFILCGALFSLLALSYHQVYFLSFDQQTGRFLYDFSHQFDWFFLAVTYIGSGYVQFPLVGFLVLYLCYQQRHHMAFVFGLNYLGVRILNHVLKGIFERARPSLPHLIDAYSFSFPSGHAMHSLACFGLLAYHLWKKRMVRSDILWGLTGGLILLIGVSRVYLGVHYPIDIVAGYMAGLAWLFLSVCLYKFVAQKGQ